MPQLVKLPRTLPGTRGQKAAVCMISGNAGILMARLLSGVPKSQLKNRLSEKKQKRKNEGLI